MKIIFAIGGNNVLDIYTSIQNAEFDKLYILCEPKQESLQRLAEDIGGEFCFYPLNPPDVDIVQRFSIEKDDTVVLDYTGDNKQIAVEFGRALELALSRVWEYAPFEVNYTYLETQGLSPPKIHTSERSSPNDVGVNIKTLSLDKLGYILSGVSATFESKETLKTDNEKPCTRYDAVKFPVPSGSWDFPTVLQVGTQLVFFTKPNSDSITDHRYALMQLYARMHQIGGFSSQGILLSPSSTQELTTVRVQDLLADVLGLYETEEYTFLSQDGFVPYSFKTIISAYPKLKMEIGMPPPRLSVWRPEIHANAADFNASIINLLEG